VLTRHPERVDTTVAGVRVAVSRTVRGDVHGWRLHGQWRFSPGEDDNWPLAWQLLQHHSGLALSDLVFESSADQEEFAHDVHDESTAGIESPTSSSAADGRSRRSSPR
jgi:hypothetical protein